MRKTVVLLLIVIIAAGIYFFSQFLSLSTKKSYGQAQLVANKSIVVLSGKYFQVSRSVMLK